MNYQIKEIDGLTGYLIDTNGEAWSKKHGRKLKEAARCKLFVGRGGYVYFNTTDGKKKKHSLVHKIVAKTFIENTKKLPMVLHNNDNKLDNRAENLRYGTAKDNVIDSFKNGKHTRGEALTIEMVNEIKEFLKTGLSQSRIAKIFNVGQPHVSRIKNDKRWNREKYMSLIPINI